MKNNKSGDIKSLNNWMIGSVILIMFLVIMNGYMDGFAKGSDEYLNYQTCKMSVQTKIASNNLIDSIKPLADFIRAGEVAENIDVVSIFVESFKGGVAGAALGPYGIATGQLIGAVNEIDSQNLLHSPQLELEDINCITDGNVLKGNKNKILKEIADGMYYCFTQFGSCDGNPFGTNPEKYCFTCSFLAFEEDQDFSEQDLQRYLDTKLAPHEKLYYSDLFAGCTSLNCHQQDGVIEPFEGEVINYKKDTPYAIFFNLEKLQSSQEIGYCEVIFTEYTVDELQNLCTYIYMSTEEN